MLEVQNVVTRWRPSPQGRCQVAEVPGYTLLAGTGVNGAWWAVKTEVRSSPHTVAKGSADGFEAAQRAAEQAVPQNITDADEWRAHAVDRDAWRPSTSGACLMRVERGYGLLVGHDWWQIRDLAWKWGRSYPGDKVLREGKASDLQDAMTRAFRYAHPEPRPAAPPTPPPAAPAAKPFVRQSRPRRTPAERAESGRKYLGYLQTQLAALQRARHIPITNVEVKAELTDAVERGEGLVRCARIDLERCRALPDHWASKPGRVEVAEVELAIAEGKLAVARLRLGPQG